MNILNNKAIIFVLIFFLIIPIFGAVNVDYAAFRGREDTSIVEIYYSIPRDMFEFKKIEGESYFRSKILIRTIFSRHDSVRNWDQWTLTDQLSDTTMNIAGQLIPEVTQFQLPAGDYDLTVIVGDMNTGEKETVKKQITVDSFSQNDLQVSDLCLATHVQKTGRKNKFSKYFGYDLVPSANLIFGQINPIIYPFYEIYNLDQSGSQKYKIGYFIEDADGKVVKDLEWAEKKKPGKTAVELYLPGIKTGELTSGSYDLIAKVIDNANNDTAIVEKQVFIINKSQRNYSSFNAGALSNFNEEQIDSMFGPLQYIATGKEKKTYKNLNLKGKKKFLSNFWKGRDSDPKTAVNETRREYETLILIANNKFTHGDNQGWKTDRGRILLKYGRPDEIDRHQNSIDQKPYVEWFYHDIQGGVKFIFVDVEGFGRYELVHSTARNELHDRQWKRYIRMTD